MGDRSPELMRMLGFLCWSTGLQRGLAIKEASGEDTSGGGHICLPLLWFSLYMASCVLGCPDLFGGGRQRRRDREVGLGLWHCRILGDFILWSSKHLRLPAGRWRSFGLSSRSASIGMEHSPLRSEKLHVYITGNLSSPEGSHERASSS